LKEVVPKNEAKTVLRTGDESPNVKNNFRVKNIKKESGKSLKFEDLERKLERKLSKRLYENV